jgi:hypothetical protein
VGAQSELDEIELGWLTVVFESEIEPATRSVLEGRGEAAMTSKDDLVGVYMGDQMACIRVQLALGSHDIPSEMDTVTLDERGVCGRLFVDRVNLERAAAVIEALDTARS